MGGTLLRNRFLPYLRPYRRYVVLTVLGGLGALAAQTQIPDVLKRIVDGPIAHGQPGEVWPYILLLAALAGVEFGLGYVRRQFSNVAGFGMERDIRNDLYAHLQGLHVGFHDEWQSGQLLSRAVGDINTVRRYVAFGLVFATLLLTLFAVVVVKMFLLDPLLAIVTAVLALPVAIVSSRFSRRYRVLARRSQDRLGDVTTVVEEAATGVRIVKAFGRSGLLSRRFQAEADRLQEVNLEAVRVRSGMWTLMSLFPNVDLTVVVLLGGLAVIRGSLTVGGLLAFISYLLMLIWPMDALGWILSTGEEARTASERLHEVFSIRPAVAEPEHPVHLPRAEGRLLFEGVGFAYETTGVRVLDGVDLEVLPGETMAIVGRTGSGKTTLLSLVPRLRDVTAGRITLDGHDLASLSLASLRGQIGVAFEDPILFSASVRENLLMGRADAGDDELLEALRVAHAEFVLELPWGLDTRVGEQGYSLSGGQRQRLALARTVVGRPRLLVLDDPLSSVDVHTEELIETALRSVLAEATALLVVHRPSTLALADRVALLEDGRIAAVGRHRDLLAENALYRELLASELVPEAEPGREAEQEPEEEVAG